MLQLQGLDHIALTVTDVARSEVWYHDVLGLERVHAEAWDYPVIMMANGSGVALFNGSIPNPADAPNSRETRTMRHFAFRVDRPNFDLAIERYKALGIPYDVQDHNICLSVFVTDPDGYEVELTTYDL